MKSHPLCILNKRCLQSLRILNIDRLDVAVEFLLRALLVVLTETGSRGKLYSAPILVRSTASGASIGPFIHGGKYGGPLQSTSPKIG